MTMKTIANIFEGIFGMSDQDSSDKVIQSYADHLVQDPDSEFAKDLYRSKITGNYSNGRISLTVPPNMLGSTINANCDIKKYIPKAKEIYSSTPIELVNTDKSLINVMDGKKFIQRISAPIIVTNARNINDIKLISRVIKSSSYHLTFRQLESISNSTLKAANINLLKLNKRPVFNNVKVDGLYWIWLEFNDTSTIKGTGLDELINWDATIQELDDKFTKVKPYDMVGLYTKLGGPANIRKLFNAIQFNPDIQPEKCISGTTLNTIQKITYRIGGMSFLFTKIKNEFTRPIEGSQWNFAILL